MDSNNYTEYWRTLNNESKKVFGIDYESLTYDKKLEIIENVRKSLNGKIK